MLLLLLMLMMVLNCLSFSLLWHPRYNITCLQGKSSD